MNSNFAVDLVSRGDMGQSLRAGRADAGIEVINELESEVRSYCRKMPVVFTSASGSLLRDQTGATYIDFLSAAGSLNYGHNDPHIRQAILDYMASDGVIQLLDFSTHAKITFIKRFNEVILVPRNLAYKMQFTGPTGANAVEAAIKLARKLTGRTQIAAFTNAFHGVSLGALALTGNASKRAAAGIALDGVIRLPYEGYLPDGQDGLAYARKLFNDPSSGVEAPAAFIVETIQGEGGINCASQAWLQAVAKLAKDTGALLIVDDIQAGCGRAGTFFSFERAEITPDLICLSKSISGIGLPMALVLIRPDLDKWAPGEHNGTFRGNNLAFVGATAALDYWENPEFAHGIHVRAEIIRDSLQSIVQTYFADRAILRGRGMFQGIAFENPEIAEKMRAGLAGQYVIAETSGSLDQVLKIMPPLNIPLETLRAGLDALHKVAASLEASCDNSAG